MVLKQMMQGVTCSAMRHLNPARIVRRMGGMKRASMVAMVMAAGCTPGMHKAYQVTMAMMATAAWSCDAMQTNAALASGMAVETNPFNGERPGAARIWASTAASSALTWSVLAVPADRIGGDVDTGNYVKDVLVTLPALVELSVVRNNADLMHRPVLRCGQ